jgi:hypothetical protein
MSILVSIDNKSLRINKAKLGILLIKNIGGIKNEAKQI